MKNKLKLILPNKKYIATFSRGMEEFRKEKTPQASSHYKLFKKPKDFPLYIQAMADNRKGINLPKGIVPQTAYWAVVGNKFVGLLKLRHTLNKELLKLGGHIGYAIIPSERKKGYATQMLSLGLHKAKKLGIKKVSLMSYEDNIASQKVIESNSGILENKVKTDGRVLLRFWVTLK